MKQAEDTKTIDVFDLPIIVTLRQIEQQIREKAEKIAELEGKIRALESLIQFRHHNEINSAIIHDRIPHRRLSWLDRAASTQIWLAKHKRLQP